MKNSHLYLIVSTFILASCGGGGGGGGGSTPTTPTTPAPTVNLSADPTSVLLESTSTLTWSSTNATSCSASWTSQTGASGSEAVTITTAGNNSFSISCSGDGGSGSASVTVEGYRETDGVVVDGYISGADVCIDEDESWTCDSNENITTSDNEGKFTIKYANGNLVSIGGTDLDSQTLLDNLLITHKLTGHSDFKAVTPVTSIAAFMEDASLVNAALGIDSSIDVSIFDPVANKGDSGINDYLYEKGNQLTVLAYALQNITNNLNTTTETTQDYFKAITEEIEKEYTETETKVDIETEAFITKALDNVIAAKSVTIDETAKANTTKALASVLPVIEVKSSDDLTTGVIRFAVSTLQTDIQAIANGTATAETVTSYTSDVLAYIAEDQNIDADEIAPDISAIADSASTSEDTAVTINVVANDSYLTSAPISVIAGNGTNGITSIAESSPEQITYEPDADYNGTDTFSYTITQGDKTSSADVTVTIEAVNDAPSIDIASTIQAQENQTAVTTVSVSDVDEDELTLTLGGTDADSFNLSDENVLTFKEAPDYETKTSYSITLTLTDGTETVTRDVTVAITNVNDVAPEFTSEATFSAAENQTAIGTVTATDAEGDDVTFTISGDELVITSAGVLTFVSAPDYETKTSYTATVTASDGINTETQDITVNITNVNDVAPAFTSDATFSAAENQTAIGTVTATDAEGDDVTFTVSGSELEITSAGVLSFVSAPDYETKTSYTATITASDGTNSTTQDITVNVTNINDNSPNFTSSATFTVDENQTAIGTVAASDADGDEIVYSISGSEITINPSSGVITFASAPDYETKTSYSATVTASDGTNSTTQDITVNITNINDNAPLFTDRTANPNYSSEENSQGQFLGTLTASDADGDSFTFSIDDTTTFRIDSSNRLFFRNGTDYESGNTSYTPTIAVSDGLNSTSLKLSITILDVNEPITFTSPTSFTVDENTTIIGTITASDPEGDDINIGLPSSGNGDDTSLFSINSSNILSLNTAGNYESKSSYELRVIGWDEGNREQITQTITVNLTNVTEAAAVDDSSSGIEDDNIRVDVLTNDTFISSDVTLTATNGTNMTVEVQNDATSIAEYGHPTIIYSPDANWFGTDSFTYTVSSGGESDQGTVTVTVTSVNDAPTITSEATFSAAENQTDIGTVTATDVEDDTLTYSISGSDISIDSSTGVMTFNSAPDYETKSTYTATVTVSDGTNSTNQNIIINITDILENSEPIITNLKTQIELQEDDKKFLYTVEATDADGDTIYFQLTGDDANKFTLSSSGDLAFKEIPDYENPTDADTDNIYEINVSVTDIAPSSTSIMPAGKSDQIETNTSNNTQVRVTNFDEDIIGLTLTSIDGNDSTGPKIRLQLVIDSYTNPNSISILYQGPNAGQYWTGAGSPTTDNFKLTYDHTFTAPDSSPSGQWRIRTIRMQTDQGQIEHKQDFLNNKGFTTTTDVYNPNSDTNKPQLESISEPVVQGNDSNPDTNITISFEITASDQENAYNRGHSRWESPASEGGWPYKGGWGSTDLSQNPPKTTFTASLDPKTVSGIYKFEDIRLYDKAGNRKMYYCIDYGDEGYKLRSEDDEIVEGAICTVNIDNPIEDNSKPQLTKFVLTGSTNTEGRKIISHEYEIDNKTSWTDQETSLRRVYLRMSGPVGYDIYDGNLPFKGDTLLPLDAPAGTYQVNFFFITDNALNDNKYYKDEMDELGFTTSVTFD